MPDLAETDSNLVVGIENVTAVPERVGTTIVDVGEEILISTVFVEELYKNVFPAPTKLKAVTTPEVMGAPADWIPILNPPTDVTTPVMLAFVALKFVIVPTPDTLKLIALVKSAPSIDKLPSAAEIISVCPFIWIPIFQTLSRYLSFFPKQL